MIYTWDNSCMPGFKILEYQLFSRTIIDAIFRISTRLKNSKVVKSMECHNDSA